MGRALVGSLVSPSADRLGGSELDQPLEDEHHRLAHDVYAARSELDLVVVGRGGRVGLSQSLAIASAGSRVGGEISIPAGGRPTPSPPTIDPVLRLDCAGPCRLPQPVRLVPEAPLEDWHIRQAEGAALCFDDDPPDALLAQFIRHAVALQILDGRRIDEPVGWDISPNKAQIAESHLPRFPMSAEKRLGTKPQVPAKTLVGDESSKIVLETVRHGEEGRRDELRIFVVVSTVTTAVVIWLLMGQRLADIPPFLQLSAEEAAGYSSAMGLDPGPTFQWLLVAALITLLALAGLAWIVSRGWPRPMRVLLLLIGIGVAFATFKGAFVRWHYMFWFASAVPVTLVLMWDRRVRVPSAAVLALTLATFLAAAAVHPVQYLDPLPQAARAIDQLRTVATPSLRHATLTYAMESMRQGYRLDPAFLGKVGQHTVHIDPWEAGVAFAFRDLRWQPLPIFQSYGAYTTALDEANADFLASSEAPERIIRMPPIGIDGRFAWFEQPATTVQMVCRYKQLDGSALFVRIPDRCGPAEQIGSVQAAIGQTIDVPTDPRPNRMIVARIHGVESSIFARLVALAWKADPWSITLNGTAIYRLVPGTASDPHILSIPATVGWAPSFAYPAPTRTISIGAGANGANDRLAIDFFSLPVAAP